ncbi:hypothetical protein [Nonomuraea sp. NPDC050540]|uniref:hypothetical protein n=1 Tax=Nonomuraea sp. NPDC050540 TaxID=3364367 RepID=UPI00378729C6
MDESILTRRISGSISASNAVINTTSGSARTNQAPAERMDGKAESGRRPSATNIRVTSRRDNSASLIRPRYSAHDLGKPGTWSAGGDSTTVNQYRNHYAIGRFGHRAARLE